MSVKKYRVYCNDESAFVTGWSESEPTTCFNNVAHTIDQTQTAITDIQLSSEVRIVQTRNVDVNPIEVDSYFLYSNLFEVDPETETDLPIELDVDSNLFTVTINTRRENIGDTWSSYVNKNTPIGVVTESSTGAIIKTAEASVAYVKPGFYVSLDGGITQIRVLDKTADTIILKESVTVVIGQPILMTYFMVYQKPILVPGSENMGSSILGSIKIPAGWTTGIRYQNNSKSKKKVAVELETTF